ncbi:MAG: hypothetical protein CMO16_03240 [Thaumarchaeota archaeon]|nr:hypothetical protein [Nitrososphaerota archaeon]
MMVKKIKEVMNKKVVKITNDKTVLDAARLMTKRSVGCIIVTSGIKVLGIVTERDFVSKVLAEPFDPKRVLLGDIATTPLFTISSNQTIKEAAELMVKYKVRRLPVIDKGSLVGIITANDLVKLITSKVKDEDLFIKAVARDKPVPSGIYT